MALNIKKTLRIDLVRSKNVLDREATLAQVADALNELQMAEELTDEDKRTIDAALARFLTDNSKQTHFPLPTLATFVCNRYLEVPINQVEAVQEKIKAYVRSDTERFYIGKGKNGGVRIVSRMTAEEKAKWDEMRKAEQQVESATA